MSTNLHDEDDGAEVEARNPLGDPHENPDRAPLDDPHEDPSEHPLGDPHEPEQPPAEESAGEL